MTWPKFCIINAVIPCKNSSSMLEILELAVLSIEEYYNWFRKGLFVFLLRILTYIGINHK